MKHKAILLASFIIIIYSCASKSGVSGSAISKVKTTSTVDEVKPVTTIAQTSEFAEGKSLYENNCAQCHRLYDTKDFSAEEWKPIVARMQINANLDDFAVQKIYNYVTMK